MTESQFREMGRKYTKAEFYEAITKELVESNEAIGRKKKLYNDDYIVLGVIHHALKQLQ